LVYGSLERASRGEGGVLLRQGLDPGEGPVPLRHGPREHLPRLRPPGGLPRGAGRAVPLRPVIPVGSVHPALVKEPERAVRDLLAGGFRGIKIHPSHQGCFPNAYRQGNRALETVYRRAEEAGLILIVHTGTSVFPGARNLYADPIHCDDLAVDFPKLKIVLAHGGRPLWMETATFLARRFPNVHLDVSSIPPQKLLEYFPRLEEMADKVLWGSDWPAPGVPGMRENADRFLALPISDGAKRRIAHENARRLFAL